MGLVEAIEYESFYCAQCGVRFAIDKRYYEGSISQHRGGCDTPEDLDDGEPRRGWYCCPNGHANQCVNNRGDVWQDQAMQLARKLEAAELEVEILKRQLPAKVNKARRHRRAS